MLSGGAPLSKEVIQEFWRKKARAFAEVLLVLFDIFFSFNNFILVMSNNIFVFIINDILGSEILVLKYVILVL